MADNGEMGRERVERNSGEGCEEEKEGGMVSGGGVRQSSSLHGARAPCW